MSFCDVNKELKGMSHIEIQSQIYILSLLWLRSDIGRFNFQILILLIFSMFCLFRILETIIYKSRHY